MEWRVVPIQSSVRGGFELVGIPIRLSQRLLSVCNAHLKSHKVSKHTVTTSIFAVQTAT